MVARCISAAALPTFDTLLPYVVIIQDTSNRATRTRCDNQYFYRRPSACPHQQIGPESSITCSMSHRHGQHYSYSVGLELAEALLGVIFCRTKKRVPVSIVCIWAIPNEQKKSRFVIFFVMNRDFFCLDSRQKNHKSRHEFF